MLYLCWKIEDYTSCRIFKYKYINIVFYLLRKGCLYIAIKHCVEDENLVEQKILLGQFV